MIPPEDGRPPPSGSGKNTSPEWWRRVFAAVDRLSELPPDEQATFLEQCSADDPALADSVKALLASGEAASPLDSSAAEYAAPIFELDAVRGQARAEARFGPYRIISEIGRGGMGAVYMAERSDDQYRKKVALKILPPWSASDDRRVQRFVEERQILAALDHPEIARLLDGGITEDGLPWFAMELVDGLRIDHYCDEQRLPVKARLELFCQVAAAVQYAHRNLVVHRDLKPANILVTPEGRVKLLDFGIAKLLGEQAPDLTVTSERLLTPLYASPEQIRGEQISTASDVYTLGVLLHVLLTGRHPYRLPGREHHEVARAVLEQDPSRPSASILLGDRVANGERGAEDIAAARGTTAPRLRRIIEGDLDAIILKAIEKEPGRRYATAEQLETDVRRHLAGQPVLAQPESRLYYGRKFVRRHRTGVAITAAVAVLVLAFGVVANVQRLRILAQAQRITLERDRAERMGEIFLNIFQNVTPGDRGIAARAILDSGTARIDQQLLAHPEQRARLTFEMAGAYHRLELHDRARELLEISLSLRRQIEPRTDLDVAETQHLLGEVLLAQGRLVPAEQAYRDALALRRQELGSRDSDVARTLVGLSSALRAQKRFTDAERASREAVQIDRSGRGDNRTNLAQSTASLAHVLVEMNEHEAALGLYRRALSLVRETHPEEHPEVADAVFDLASALRLAGRSGESDSLLRYGIGLQRRLLTAAQLRGVAQLPGRTDAPPSRAGEASEDMTAQVERALAAQPERRIPTGQFVNRHRIAFVSDRDGPDPVGDLGNSEVYTMNTDGTGQRRLTHFKGGDSNPVWSHDGRMIAFDSQRGGGFDIFIMNSDGTDPRRLTNLTARGLGAINPAWSPDGKRIAFQSRVKEIDIYVINADGTGLRKITHDIGSAGTPAWSPDGRKIAFNTRRHGPPEIYVMDSDGRNQVRLTANQAIDMRPAWSPDGKRIAFHSDRDGNLEVYVMNADGSNQARLTDHAGRDAHPSWSPDGRRIVFHREVLGHLQIHVMNADGTGVRRLTELSAIAFNGFPNWGPANR